MIVPVEYVKQIANRILCEIDMFRWERQLEIIDDVKNMTKMVFTIKYPFVKRIPIATTDDEAMVIIKNEFDLEWEFSKSLHWERQQRILGVLGACSIAVPNGAETINLPYRIVSELGRYELEYQERIKKK